MRLALPPIPRRRRQVYKAHIAAAPRPYRASAKYLTMSTESAEDKRAEVAHYDDAPDHKDGSGLKDDLDADSLERALREDHVRAINMNTSAK